jgi:hypothetical protein
MDHEQCHSIIASKNKPWSVGMRRVIGCIILILFLALNSGCALFVAAGAGMAGGYYLKEKGYKIQSPIEKEGNKKDAGQK